MFMAGSTARWIACSACGKAALARGHNQKYCVVCSDAANSERKSRWEASRPEKRESNPAWKRNNGRERKDLAATLSRRRGPSWMAEPHPQLLWMAGVQVPFSWAYSKNHIYSLNGRGHIHLRDEHRAARDLLTLKLKRAVATAQARVVTNKLWIDILVEKSSHRGDAVNVIDGVCDAIKKAIPLDDRWYSIRRLDWEVVPQNGHIFVGVGQDTDQESQVCSCCGRIQVMVAFTKNRSAATGYSRVCIECSQIVQMSRRAIRKPEPR